MLCTVDCPPGLYSSVCSRVSLGALSLDSTSTVPGQLAGPCLLGSSGQATRPGTAVTLSLSGDCDKRREVGSRALAVCNLLGHDHRYRCCQGLSHPCVEGKVPLGSGAVPYCDNSPAWLWQVLLGHLSSLEKLVPHGRLRMCSLQWHLKTHWSPESDPPDLPAPRSREVKEDLSWWMVRDRLLMGVPFGMPAPDLHVHSETSQSGWGAHLLDRLVSGVWSVQESSLHINRLEMEALFLALQPFQESVTGHHVTAMCNNSTVVAYINRQGGTVSNSLCLLTRQLLQ